MYSLDPGRPNKSIQGFIHFKTTVLRSSPGPALARGTDGWRGVARRRCRARSSRTCPKRTGRLPFSWAGVFDQNATAFCHPPLTKRKAVWVSYSTYLNLPPMKTNGFNGFWSYKWCDSCHLWDYHWQSNDRCMSRSMWLSQTLHQWENKTIK